MTVYLPAVPGYSQAGAALNDVGLAPADVVHVVEYVTGDAPDLTALRNELLGGHAVPVATVAVEAIPGGEPYVVELTAHPGGGELAGALRIADGIVYLPSVHPDVHAADFRGQYRSCLERAAELLKEAGLGPQALVRTIDYTATATRAEYPRCGRPRKELLGGTGSDGKPVFPGAAGILVDRPLLPGAMVSLDAIASTEPLRTVNPGWARYETLTYKPGIVAGGTLFMSGFGALEPATQKAIFDGDLLAQAEFTYAGIATVLREAGLTGQDVVRLIEYVTPDGVAGYPELADLRERYFGEVALTSVVCSALLRPEFLIEVVPVAVFR